MKQTILDLLQKPGSQESMLRLVSDAVPALIAYYEISTLQCVFANLRYAQYNGWTPDSILGKTVREVVGEAAWAVIVPYVEQVQVGKACQYTREQTLPDGNKRTIEVNLNPHFDENKLLQGCFVLITDITEHWRVETALRQSEERLRKFAQATREGIVFHVERRITDTNDAMLGISGYTRTELVGHFTDEFVPESWHERMREQFLSGSEEPYESVILHKDGHEVPIDVVMKTMPLQGQNQRMLVIRDVTNQRKAQARIEFLALHDPLTQLPNRAHLREQLESTLALARRRGSSLAVLFIDLDNFKTVNDSLGHHVGDDLLRRVAQRITTTVRDSDLVSRLGGDEFVVVLSEVANSQDAALVAQKLLEAVSAPIDIEGHRLTVSPSVGISLFPADGDSSDDLIRHADSAMYYAKESGRATYKFFMPELFKRASIALDLSRELGEAQRRREFVLHYQPQQRRLDGAIVGMEALVRWQHPGRGLVGPDEFIAFAETQGLVGGIDLWVLQAACRQMKTWHDMGSLKVPVAVNLSAINFRQGNLADEVAGILLETGLDAIYLEIEITESVFLDRGGHAQKTMRRLRDMGVHLTLDDFGTGYSSLAYLKQYPIGKLKIDRSFVHDLTTDSGNLALVTAVIQMAHGLKLKAVAEGVETRGQLDLLKQLGCDEFQGFLISRPVDAIQARAFIGK